MTGYTDRIKAAVALGVIPPGEVTHVTVEHAPTCRHNPCTCFPLVTAKVRGEVLTPSHAPAYTPTRAQEERA